MNFERPLFRVLVPHSYGPPMRTSIVELPFGNAPEVIKQQVIGALRHLLS